MKPSCDVTAELNSETVTPAQLGALDSSSLVHCTVAAQGSGTQRHCASREGRDTSDRILAPGYLPKMQISLNPGTGVWMQEVREGARQGEKCLPSQAGTWKTTACPICAFLVLDSSSLLVECPCWPALCLRSLTPSPHAASTHRSAADAAYFQVPCI